jgi:hypothetical protein
MEGISKAATMLPVSMKLNTIACNDRGHINVMLVLQSCTDSLQVMAGSSSETFPAPSDGAYDTGLIKFEESIEMKEEIEVYVKTEKVISSKEEECWDMKDDDGIYSEEEQEKKEKIDTKEEEDVDLQEEVSRKGTA